MSLLIKLVTMFVACAISKFLLSVLAFFVIQSISAKRLTSEKSRFVGEILNLGPSAKNFFLYLQGRQCQLDFLSNIPQY